MKNLKIIALVIGSLAFANCSKSSGDESEDNADLETNSSGEDAAQVANSGANEAFAGDGDFGTNSQGKTGQAANMGVSDEISNSNIASLTNSGTAPTPPTESIPVNSAVTGTSNASTPPLNAGMGPTANVATIPATTETTPPVGEPTTNNPAPAAATGSGAVKYVADASLAIMDQPGGKNVVGTLERGDHPLVYQEGEFARLSNGAYISTKGLSDRGIGRARRTGSWK